MKKLIGLIVVFFLTSALLAQNADKRSMVITLLNYIATEASRTAEHKEDSLLLEDIYNRLESDIQHGLLDDNARNEFIRLFNRITDFQKEDIRRQKIRYLRDQAKANAIKQAIPSPVFFLSLTSNFKNPLAMAVNILGMAAQSVTSYLNATDQAEMRSHEQMLELKGDQLSTLNTLRTAMFNYLSVTAKANGLIENYDTVSPAAIKDFLDFKKQDIKLRIENLERNQAVYQNYYPYWLELANSYHADGRYQDCVAAIGKYESVWSPIFRPNCNSGYAVALAKGIDSLTHIYRNNPAAYAQRCLVYLEKIEQNVPDRDWAVRYSAALAYLDLASNAANSSTGKTYLEKSYRLLRGNVANLIPQQNNAIESFQSAKVRSKELLHMIDETFYFNYTSLVGVMELLNSSRQERDSLDAILGNAAIISKLRDECCDLTASGFDFKSDPYFKKFYFNTFNGFSSWDYATIPLIFLVSGNSVIDVEYYQLINGKKTVYYEEKNVEWQIMSPPYADISKRIAILKVLFSNKFKETWLDSMFIDFIISDAFGVYRVKYFRKKYAEDLSSFYGVTKEG